MLVLGILSTAVATLFIGSLRTTQSTQTRLEQENSARVAVEAMTRVLRTAVLPSSLASCSPSCGATAAFIEGTPTSVAFYADIDNTNNSVGPSQVTFSIDPANELVETVQPADPGSAATGYTWTPCTLGAPGCSLQKRVLATNVTTAASNLFTYYSYGDLTPISGTLNATQLANVDAVDIVLAVHKPGDERVAPTSYVGRVALPNVDTVIEASATPSS